MTYTPVRTTLNEQEIDMAFGLTSEGESDQDRADARFLAHVEDWVGRPLTLDEEGLAFDLRDQGCNPKEAAEEVMAQVEPVTS